MPNAKPERPWTKPATMAPRATMRKTESTDKFLFF
jgi:hypothetical protein